MRSVRSLRAPMPSRAALLVEMDPRRALQLLPDWERFLGLPDGCPSVYQDLASRRSDAHLRLVPILGVSPADIEAMGAAAGYHIDVWDAGRLGAAAGIVRAAAAAPTACPGLVARSPAQAASTEWQRVWGTGGAWRYIWGVDIRAQIRYRRVVDPVNQQLAIYGDTDPVICRISKIVPAHTCASFSVVGLHASYLTWLGKPLTWLGKPLTWRPA